ncbi:MFS transporter (plasmid) [Niallia taxi]|uniref:MFS transporter n=1 Tax=Niallia taxi TaxID=2499688 RepID=UPI002934ABDE|nr:MFS transporter [Niallia taxi]WOD64843.1 MFS transporter [Niallia taxi]
MTMLFKSKGAMILLMLNMFLAMAAFGLVVPVMPEYIKMLGLSGTIAGFLTAAFAVTQLFFSPFAGRFSDQYGRKKAIVFGMVVLAVSEAIFALGSSAIWLFISRFLGGLGIAFVAPAVMAFIADITTEQERAKGIGYISAAMSTGFLIGPGIGGFLAEYGTRVPFYAAAIGAGIAALITWLVLPEVNRVNNGDVKNGISTSNQGILRMIISSVKAPYFNALIVLLVLGFALSNFETVFGLYLDAKYNFNPKDIAVIMTIGAVVGVIIQLGILDLLVKKIGELKVIYLSLLVAGLSIMCIIIANSYWSLIFVTIIVFAACDLLRPAASSYLSKQAGTDQGYVAGLNSSYNSIGTILGSAAAGILYDVSIGLPYIIAGAILILCYFSLLVVDKYKPRARNKTFEKIK